jgi:hypothetical protein
VGDATIAGRIDSGKTVARLQTSDGVIAGLSYAPSMHS